LLVVIAIIAVLLSILMPALRKVREQGNMIKCLANLKEWNLIFSMYLQENDEKFFSGGNHGIYWWIAQLPDNQQSYKKNKVWFCPKNTGTLYDVHSNFTGRFTIFAAWGIFTRNYSGVAELCPDGIAGSYGLNGFLLNTNTPPEQTLEGVQVKDWWKTPQVKGAAQVPLMSEALRFDLWPHETEGPAQDEFAAWEGNRMMGRTCINRHIGFENVSFCDFSARKVGLKELWTFKWHRRFNTQGPWTKAGGVNASDWPEWIRRFKDY
jgi:Tfp pilus assembly major pilin PilA